MQTSFIAVQVLAGDLMLSIKNRLPEKSTIFNNTPEPRVMSSLNENTAFNHATEGDIGYTDKIVPESKRLEKLGEVFDEKTLKKMGIIECSTCASRTYQDKSDDSGVSFQTPTHLDPDQAASAVMAHEQEHVTREQADAEQKGREVISQSVQIQSAICPECGRSYVSGGTTKTMTRTKETPYKQSSTADFVGNLYDFKL
jgi:hypothetical protein